MKRDAIIIGYSRLAEDLIANQLTCKHPVLQFKGIIADIETDNDSVEVVHGLNKINVSLLGPVRDLLSLLNADDRAVKPMLIIAENEGRDSVILHAISECISRGYEIYEIADVYEMVTGRVPVLHVHERWLLHAFNKPQMGYMMFKRISDFIIALFGIIITSPLIAVISMMIKLTSKGDILYKQTRVGKNGREFIIYKFRTMVNDAEDDGAVWAVKDDPRVTMIGRWLRKLRLDELPQLINVLTGDMSIIGPRPERPEFVKQLSKDIPFYNYRHIVKPGITGWAQVRYCYACSVEGSLEKLQFDLYGIRNAGLEYDIEVLLRTVWVMLSGAGAH